MAEAVIYKMHALKHPMCRPGATIDLHTLGAILSIEL